MAILSGRPARWTAGWRLALRIARREALRSRGRSALVLVMVSLPVLAVVTAAVLQSTQDLSGKEGLSRRIGDSQALVDISRRVASVRQAPDPADLTFTDDGRGPHQPLTAAELHRVLPDAELVPIRRTSSVVTTPSGDAVAMVLQTDLRSPLAAGLVRLVDGRLPSSPCEVTVDSGLRSLGVGIGDELEARGATASCPLRVVGIADSTTYRDGPPFVAGAVGITRYRDASFYADPVDGWLVGGPAVSWAQVQQLNARGAVVTSRAVIDDPPPVPASVRAQLDQISSPDRTVVAALVLIATMVLLEVVLLAGPAFAVGARRQSRDLALLATAGSTPAQARRVVLGTAVVLGSVAAVIGSALGIAIAALLRGPFQNYSSTWLGPFDVPWKQVVVVAALGLLSALLAAIVPAWVASRQDVVAVLAGRRSDTAPRLRFPIAGAVISAIGVGIAYYGSRGTYHGTMAVSVCVVVLVLGMLLLVPTVVVGVARIARRAPLPLRLAARDAARHRTRTVPAVAAVAGSVAGVVALGIALSSDDAAQRASYIQTAPLHSVSMDFADQPVDAADWRRITDLVHENLPGASIEQIDAVDAVTRPGSGTVGAGATLRIPHSNAQSSFYGYNAFGTSVAVASTLPSAVEVTEAQRRATDAALAEGRMVVYVTAGADPRIGSTVRARLHLESTPERTGRGWRTHGLGNVTARAAVVEVAPSTTLMAVVPPSLLRAHGLSAGPAGLVATPRDGVPDALAVSRLTAGLQQVLPAKLYGDGSSSGPTVYVENGPGTDQGRRTRLILGALAAVLMIGGTLTATFLALSDARADLATLAAVGGTPRVRRLVAGGHALVIGGVGALLGALVGVVPGVAISLPITRGYALGGGYLGSSVGHVVVPWGFLAMLVVVLPLLIAALVSVTARSRLPLARRID